MNGRMAVDPLRIFLSAEAFRVAVETLSIHYHSTAKKAVYVYPIFVNAALTSELYLKCLVAIKTPFLPKNHQLHRLFDALPKIDRATVINRYKALCNATPAHAKFFQEHPQFKDDIRSVLEDSSEVFSKIRYAYEGLPPGTKMHAYFQLPYTAIRTVILECHPEWPSKISPSSPPTFRLR